MAGVPVAGALAGPGPIAFRARRATVYSAPLVRLVSVQVPATPTHGHHETPPSKVTS